MSITIRWSDRSEPMPDIPLDWWKRLPYEGYYVPPVFTNWWPLTEADEPKRGDEDMRC
jgi:hypothetical protein